jgi:hypothetical protein
MDSWEFCLISMREDWCSDFYALTAPIVYTYFFFLPGLFIFMRSGVLTRSVILPSSIGISNTLSRLVDDISFVNEV